MMAKLTLLAFALLHVRLSTADPHDHPRHKHRPRDSAVTTQYFAQAGSVDHDLANIIVYVDESGAPVSTATVYEDPSSTAQETTTFPRPFRASATTADPSTAADSDQGSPGADGPAEAFSIGVTYSPYNADHSCKDGSAVAHDLSNIADFSVIRLYGTDCNQVANVANALSAKTSIFAGIYNINDVENEISLIDSGIKGNWESISAVSVGNELVNSGQATVEQVTDAITAARSALKAKGYTGPVTTVDTMMALQNNPKLCQASDFCAINCHAFFDGHVGPADAGKFVSDWVQKISAAAGGKRVVVTESGWPTQGNANGEATPGWAEHNQAIGSLKESVKKDLILFTLYDDLWKQDQGDTFNAEKYWGLRG